MLMADDAPEHDPDRAAILARRQRFIALALSGLAGAAACDACEPKPCLNVATPQEDGGDAKTGDAKTGDAKTGDAKTGDAKTGDTKTDGTPTAEPRVCLSMAPIEPDPKPTLQPCLHGGPPPKPQPCLEVMPDPKATPQPCLDVDPQPAPCLNVRREKPAPQACLSTRPGKKSDGP